MFNSQRQRTDYCFVYQQKSLETANATVPISAEVGLEGEGILRVFEYTTTDQCVIQSVGLSSLER
jgi:hypothetical protein